MRVMAGCRGGSQHLGAVHSLAHGQEQPKLAISIKAFFSSSVPVKNMSTIQYLLDYKHFIQYLLIDRYTIRK